MLGVNGRINGHAVQIRFDKGAPHMAPGHKAAENLVIACGYEIRMAYMPPGLFALDGYCEATEF